MSPPKFCLLVMVAALCSAACVADAQEAAYKCPGANNVVKMDAATAKLRGCDPIKDEPRPPYPADNILANRLVVWAYVSWSARTMRTAFAAQICGLRGSSWTEILVSGVMAERQRRMAGFRANSSDLAAFDAYAATAWAWWGANNRPSPEDVQPLGCDRLERSDDLTYADDAMLRMARARF